MSPLRRKLARPALHLLVAGLTFAAFHVPVLFNRGPIATWLSLYGAWAASIVVLVVLSFADDSPEED
ncbi:MAG: hypothetical protein MUC96_26780 [Myxococcaceae bacterium]|jgi:hypothetical protein|nr:hypothetical protein [Myxococcaceae bacterium]